MNAMLTTKTTSDWVEVLEAAGVPCGPVYDYAQLFADPQVRHRGLVQYASDASQDRRGRAGAQCRAKLGQHNVEIFGRLGVSNAEMKDCGR